MRKISLLLISTALLITVSCGPSVKVNANAKFPVAVSDTTPAFLFPINMSHCGITGDPTLQGVSVTAGVVAQYGKKVVSGQQLFDLVGNLSYELAETISSQAHAETWKMSGGAEHVASTLASTMQKILDKLVSLNLIPAGYKFKYIIALHSHGSAGMAPKTVNMESWGGIYDVDTKEILAYIEDSSTMVDDEKAAMVQIPTKYNSIIGHLIDGK